MTDLSAFPSKPLASIGTVVNADPSPIVTDVSSSRSPVKPVQDALRGRLSSRSVAPTNDNLRSGLFALSDEERQSTHDHVIVCPKSTALLLGRASAMSAQEDESLTSTTTQDAVGGVPVRRVALPNTARHVSRDHCILYHTPFSASWAVKILGQNGLIVDGKRHRAGSILRLSAGVSFLDFFGLRCLFVGPEGQDVQSAVATPLRATSEQDGRSPVKATRAPMSLTLGAATGVNEHATDVLRTATSPVVTGQGKLLGNMHKRPQGAPLSPPTSSPAPFDRSSPPLVARQSLQRSRGLLSSSPVESDEEEDVATSPRVSSPTLHRRAVKDRHDDSGVLMQGTAEAEVESEDEASQALTAAPKSMVSRRSASLAEGRKASQSPAGTPRGKRVKFTPGTNGNGQGQAASNGSGSKSAAVLPATMLAVQMHYRNLVATLARTYDLQGLLAGSIVFHRTATISATEAVRSVLSANPGLMRGEVGPEGVVGQQAMQAERGNILDGWTRESIIERGLVKEEEADRERVEIWQRKAWREQLEGCLLEGECFGIIQRAGKDASGNPLECWYYYDKEHDPDAQRAANLGAFAKPMRAALKTHKPIFWRRSAYGTTSDDVKALQNIVVSVEPASAGHGATESQWGSSGSTLSTSLLTGTTLPNDRPDAGARRTAGNTGKGSGASASTWEETQFEETEQTWDKEGDLDFEVSGPARRTKRRK